MIYEEIFFKKVISFLRYLRYIDSNEIVLYDLLQSMLKI